MDSGIVGFFFTETEHLLLSSTTEDLSLLDTDDASSLVLTLLTLLTRGLGLLEETNAAKAVAGLIGLQSLHVVVDQTKTGGLTSSESSLEAIDHNELLIGDFVHLGHLGGDLGLGDSGASRVDDIHDLHRKRKISSQVENHSQSMRIPLWLDSTHHRRDFLLCN